MWDIRAGGVGRNLLCARHQHQIQVFHGDRAELAPGLGFQFELNRDMFGQTQHQGPVSARARTDRALKRMSNRVQMMLPSET